MTKNKTLTSDDIVTARPLGRRAAVGLIGASVASALIVGASTASAQEGARAACSDSDPYDPGGYGRNCGAGCFPCRGVSDSDPRDPAGCGCHTCTDSDPSDAAGSGRHC